MERDVCALCRALSVLGLIASLAAAIFLGLLLIPPHTPSHSVVAPTTAAALVLFVGVTLVSRATAQSLRR